MTIYHSNWQRNSLEWNVHGTPISNALFGNSQQRRPRKRTTKKADWSHQQTRGEETVVGGRGGMRIISKFRFQKDTLFSSLLLARSAQTLNEYQLIRILLVEPPPATL